MKRHWAAAVSVLLLVTATPAVASNRFADTVVSDYIVVFKKSTGLDDELKSWTDRKFHLRNSFSSAFKGMVVGANQNQLRTLRNDPDVLYIETDDPISISATTTQSNAPWNLDRIDQLDLPLNNTYNYEATGAGVNIYIVDTGILSSHTEFSGRVSANGFSAISDGRNTKDCHGHGTHVAGTAAGSNFGVAKRATLIPVRVLNCLGQGSDSTVISGLDWITSKVDFGTKAVVNLSLGGGFSQAVNDAVQRLVSKGAVVVVASGNEGMPACNSSPASAPNAITVSATSVSDGFSTFSNSGSCVDILAPGEMITSSSTTFSGRSTYDTSSGTSMASPHVAGAAALLLQAGYQSPSAITTAILGSSISGTINGVPVNTPNRFLNVGIPLNSPKITPANQSVTGYVGSPVSSTAIDVQNLAGYSLTVNPSLPAGWSMNASTGVITGIPSETLNNIYTITATSDTNSAQATVAFNIQQPFLSNPSQNITGNVGKSMSSAVLTATGLSGSVAFSISNLEDMPGGLSLNLGNGVISGTPTTQQGATLNIRATGSTGGVANGIVTISIGPSVFAIAPEAPTGVSALAGRRGEATVTWTIGNNNGSLLTFQTVTTFEIRSGLVRRIKSEKVSSNTNTFRVTGLFKGRGYFFEVSATNSYGTSAKTSSNRVIAR